MRTPAAPQELDAHAAALARAVDEARNVHERDASGRLGSETLFRMGS